MARPLEVVRHCCLAGTSLERADLRYMDLRGGNFTNSNLRGADMTGVDMAYGFFLGARFGPPLCKTDQMRNVDKAVFHWYWDPQGGIPSYDPQEGYVDLWRSVLGGISLQENAATRKT